MSMEAHKAEADGNMTEYTVSELSNLLKRTVEDRFALVRVRGELSGVKRHGSGHLYFCLKDQDAVLDGVAWRNTAGRLKFRPEDGLEVVVVGRLTTYPGRSKYQIVVEHMEPAGVGALMALLEERKRKLTAEGLFEAARKRPLPFLPRVIGVVTSPTGAVIRDILHRLADRFPSHVLLWPVAVQGESAAEQVARAIKGFNALGPDGPVPRPDLLIVARGGGSIEDLWAFNEDVVVRAAAASTIPLISAVGHETDTTLIDFASDRRAPTPTAAAEMAVPVRAELLERLAETGLRLARASRRLTAEQDLRLQGLTRALRHPRLMIEAHALRLDDLGERLPRALLGGVGERRRELAEIAGGLRPRLLEGEIRRKGETLETLNERLLPAILRLIEGLGQKMTAPTQLLESLSYHRVLARGYTVVRHEGRVVQRGAALTAAGTLEIEFSDGLIAATVSAGPTGPGSPGSATAQPVPTRRGRRKGPKGPKGDSTGGPPPAQGTLL